MNHIGSKKKKKKKKEGLKLRPFNRFPKVGARGVEFNDVKILTLLTAEPVIFASIPGTLQRKTIRVESLPADQSFSRVNEPR